MGQAAPGARVGRLRTVGIPALLFSIVFAAHVNSAVTTSFDSRWSLYTALSLMHRGDTDLDEYAEVIAREDGYAIERVGSHVYSVYPVGASLVAVPFLLVIEPYYRLVLGQDLDTQMRRERNLHARIERQIASAVVALAAVVMYVVGLVSLLSRPRAVILALVFAFGTSAWSTASRALWQHGPSMLCLAVALVLLLQARAHPERLPWAGGVLAFATAVRPTNILPLAGLTAFLLHRYRPWARWWLAAVAAVLLPLVAFYWTVYGAPLPPYYGSAHTFGVTALAEALAGNLVSPARGLFVFSPVLIFALPGMWLCLRDHRHRELGAWLVALLVAHWVIVSSLYPWWAGDSYGPRFFTDMLPYLVYFLVPVLARLSWRPGLGSRALTVAFAVLFLASALIHGRGAMRRDGYAWNAEPIHVDRAPERLWDWRDLPFLRGLQDGKRPAAR